MLALASVAHGQSAPTPPPPPTLTVGASVPVDPGPGEPFVTLNAGDQIPTAVVADADVARWRVAVQYDGDVGIPVFSDWETGPAGPIYGGPAGAYTVWFEIEHADTTVTETSFRFTKPVPFAPMYLGALGATVTWRDAGGGVNARPAVVDGNTADYSGAKFDGASVQFVNVANIPANIEVHSVVVTAERRHGRTTPAVLKFDGIQISDDIVNVIAEDAIESTVWPVGRTTKPDGTSSISVASLAGPGWFLFYEIHIIGRAI